MRWLASAMEEQITEINFWWYQFYAAGDCGQAGSAWRKGIVKGNKLFPLTACAIRTLFHLRENRCPPSEKNKTVRNAEISCC